MSRVYGEKQTVGYRSLVRGTCMSVPQQVLRPLPAGAFRSDPPRPARSPLFSTCGKSSTMRGARVSPFCLSDAFYIRTLLGLGN